MTRGIKYSKLPIFSIEMSCGDFNSYTPLSLLIRLIQQICELKAGLSIFLTEFFILA